MRQVRTLLLGAATIAALSTTVIAPAHAYWRWRPGPHGWARFWVAPGVVVAGPAYVAPPPGVYIAPPAYYAPPPPPVYYAPAPVYVAPPVVSFGLRIR